MLFHMYTNGDNAYVNIIKRKFQFLFLTNDLGNYSSLRADFFLVRNINYYVIQMYIPSLLIVMLSWVSFWLNVNSVPGRVNLGVLSVLTISTQSSSVNRTLPRVSYTKAIDIWMAACLVFVVAALVEFAIANVLSRRGSGKGMMFIKKIIKLARDKNRNAEINKAAETNPEGSGIRHREKGKEKDVNMQNFARFTCSQTLCMGANSR